MPKDYAFVTRNNVFYLSRSQLKFLGKRFKANAIYKPSFKILSVALCVAAAINVIYVLVDHICDVFGRIVHND